MNFRDKLARLPLRGPEPASAADAARAIAERLRQARIEEVESATAGETSERSVAAAVDPSPAQSSSPLAPFAALAGDRTQTLAALRARLESMRSASTRSLAPAGERVPAPSLPASPRDRAPSRVARAETGDDGWAPSSLRTPERVAAAAVQRATSYATLIRGEDDELAPYVKPREAGLPGERCATPHGELQRVLTTYDLEHRHGSAAVALGRDALAEDVAMLALDPGLAEVDFSRALYIDTETTGLMGGSGTLPFLIGVAWFEGGELSVEQLLLPRPGLEVPLLARLAERMRASSAIVSYNGKSFDWPLLRTRFVLNRLAVPVPPPHLDLLHCARRVYKARLGSVRLVYLEQELLGYERVDDMPGELIPQTYFAYLRGELPGSTLAPVLEHNRSDLVALPALLGEILRRFRGEHLREDARDKLGFAKVAARARVSERALACANAAVERDARGELAPEALSLVGALKLKSGDVAGAVAAFEAALEASVRACDRARAHHALAKLHEHKTKSLSQALEHARQTSAWEGEAASTRRVERLLARLERAARTRSAAEPRKRRGSERAPPAE